ARQTAPKAPRPTRSSSWNLPSGRMVLVVVVWRGARTPKELPPPRARNSSQRAAAGLGGVWEGGRRVGGGVVLFASGTGVPLGRRRWRFLTRRRPEDADEPRKFQDREAGVVVAGLGVLTVAAAIVGVQGDQLAQQGAALQLRQVGQVVLDGGAAAIHPSLFE